MSDGRAVDAPDGNSIRSIERRSDVANCSATGLVTDKKLPAAALEGTNVVGCALIQTEVPECRIAIRGLAAVDLEVSREPTRCAIACEAIVGIISNVTISSQPACGCVDPVVAARTLGWCGEAIEQIGARPDALLLERRDQVIDQL